MKEKNNVENEIVLTEGLKREIELYEFENAMVSARLSAEKKYQDAQKNYEQVQAMYEDILRSRTWRFSAPLRRISHYIKSLFRNSAFGRFTLRVLKKIFG